MKLKLCYVDECWAYFTTQELSKQWGDDWNDAPYEHNAGPPYVSYKEDEPKWEIIKVAWEGAFDTPDEGHTNSPYSVEQINAGVVAWLRSYRWCKKQIIIQAGVSLEEFKELIKAGGGTIYEEG